MAELPDSVRGAGGHGSTGGAAALKEDGGSGTRTEKARAPKRSERSKLDATPPWETRMREEPEATRGPFDERDAPEDDITRADLGALRVPVGARLTCRSRSTSSNRWSAPRCPRPRGTMQVGVFAAPRNEGIWDEVRAEIAASMAQQRGNRWSARAGRSVPN